MKAQVRRCIARQLLTQPSRSSRGDIYSRADPRECSLQDSAPTLPIDDVGPPSTNIRPAPVRPLGGSVQACHKEFKNVTTCCLCVSLSSRKKRRVTCLAS